MGSPMNGTGYDAYATYYDAHATFVSVNGFSLCLYCCGVTCFLDACNFNSVNRRDKKLRLHLVR